jgi:hypothetical protein
MMSWLRLHHGTAHDPKFRMISKKSGCSVAEVLAIWICLLEAASMAEDRGNPGSVDFESLDCSLGLADGSAAAVFEIMRERSLIDVRTGRLCAWEKRQPKREREDDSTGRVKNYRQRQRLLLPGNATETPSANADRQETPRLDETRREGIGENEGNSEQITALQKSPCPHIHLLELFARILPQLPQPKAELWNGKRADAMKSRWKWVLTARQAGGERYATDEAEALDYFKRYFEHVAKSDYLTGRMGGWTGCNLGWLMNADNFAKVIEGNYDNKVQP